MSVEREKLVQKIVSRVLLPLWIINGLSILCVLTTPLIFIWGTWTLTWKIGLTGVCVGIITSLIYHFFKWVINEYIDEEINKINPTSKFQELLNKLKDNINN